MLLSRPERRINGPTITHLWSMLKLLDTLVQLDHLKSAKASIPNDFSWYRTFTQVSVQWHATDSMREELDDLQDDADDDWFPEDMFEAFKELRKRRIFDVSDMYTNADAWGWTWEREYKNKPPRRWSQEWEVEMAIKVTLKVMELGGTPTIGDCAMILRAAIKAPLPSVFFLKILQTTHILGYVFGSPLYDEIISLCLDLGELAAAVAIVADLVTTGITVPERVISARQTT